MNRRLPRASHRGWRPFTELNDLRYRALSRLGSARFGRSDVGETLRLPEGTSAEYLPECDAGCSLTGA